MNVFFNPIPSHSQWFFHITIPDPRFSLVLFLFPVIVHIANLSFRECRFPAAFKTGQVLPLLKNPSLDKAPMSSYRLILNLTTVSKAGAGQTEAPPACVAELCLSTVGVPAWTFDRDSTTACRELCMRPLTRRRLLCWLALTFWQPLIPSTMTSSSAVLKASLALTAVLPAGCTRTSQTGSSLCNSAIIHLLQCSAPLEFPKGQCSSQHT